MTAPRITLATLPTATAQAVYDQVARHLLTQGQPCTDLSGAICLYRNDTGRQCAAGCLIGPDEYSAEFENVGWDALSLRGNVPRAHLDLIDQLQGTHDTYKPRRWPVRLREVAAMFRLSPAVVDEFAPIA
jgi:hypothetical protein